MLKITPLKRSPDTVVLGLEGRLIGPWVEELRVVVASANVSTNKIQFDLSRVSYVDSNGLELLMDLLQRGAVMLRATPFIKEMLRGDKT